MKILYFELKRLTNIRILAFTAIFFAVLFGFFYRGVSLHNTSLENNKLNGNEFESVKLVPPGLAGFLAPEQYSSILKISVSDSYRTEIVQNVTGSSLSLIDNFVVFLLLFFAVFFYTGATFCSGYYYLQYRTLRPLQIIVRILVRFLLQNILVQMLILSAAVIIAMMKGFSPGAAEKEFITDFFLVFSVLNFMFFTAGTLCSYLVRENRHKNTVLTITAAVLIFVLPVITNFILPDKTFRTEEINSSREVYAGSSDKEAALEEIGKLNCSFYKESINRIEDYESLLVYSPVSYMINLIENGTGKGARAKVHFLDHSNKINMSKFKAANIDKTDSKNSVEPYWNAPVYLPVLAVNTTILYSGIALALLALLILFISRDKKKITSRLDYEALDSSIRILLEEGGAFGFLKAEKSETGAIAYHIADEYAYLRWSDIRKADWPGNMSVFEILDFLNLSFDREKAIDIAIKNNVHYGSDEKNKQTYSAKLVMASKERLNLRAEDFRKKIGSLEEEKIVKLIGCCYMTSVCEKLVFEDVFINIKEREITFFKDFFKKLAEQENKYILYVGSEYFPVFDPMQFADNSSNLYPVHKETKSFTRH